MTAIEYSRPAAFRIGRVFGDSFGVIGRNLVLCIGLSVIFSGIPTLLIQWWTANSSESADPATQLSVYMLSAGGIAVIIGAWLVSFMLVALLQASLTRASIEDLNGGRPSFGDCLNTALGALLPVMVIALLFYLGIGIGFMLLIVPGVILWLRWSVAIPVQVNERLGILRSMSRSAELTRGSRWALLGLYLILIVAIIALQLVLALALAFVTPMFGSLGAALALGIVSSLSTVLLSIVAAVSYVELRLVKEGTDVKDLAEIFA